MRATLASALAGRYTLQDEIGRGGMATVFRAVDIRHERPVAVKVMHPEFTATVGRDRFLREIRVTANLAHPHILPLHDSGEADGLLYYVTPLVDGLSLRQRLEREGRLPIADARKIAREVADALAHAHARGVVHRDIKPENILLNGYRAADDKTAWSAVVADFGVSAVRDAARDEHLTRTGTSVGSALYMSPEQALAERVDERTDVWSLGCVLHEMLTGEPPFGRDPRSAIARALTERAPPLRDVRDSGVQDAIGGALVRDPAQRLASMRDFAGALEERARPRRFGILVAGVLLVVIGGATWIALRSRGQGPGASEFTQLTNFSDAVTAPALSPDGRFVAFLRGSGPFGNSAAPAQLYIKQLPNGEPVQLTNSAIGKGTPAFSPDGSRIAFTTSESNFSWGTEIVSVNGGNAAQLLPNASGLSWLNDGRVLFSENRGGMHMGVRSASVTRADTRDVYWPASSVGMAHRSAASPDQKSVLLAEMDNGIWSRCRLLPLDGSSTGTLVGPPDAQCTYATWSPNGRWMYFTANTGSGFHVWRQRHPDGQPQQLTHGPTEEEGIAMAPDGKSFVTAAGVRLNSIRLMNDAGEQPVSDEGFALLPKASKDGKRVFFLSLPGGGGGAYQSGSLVAVTLASGAREEVLPEQLIAHFDLSQDDRQLLFVAAPNDQAKQGLWIAQLDRSQAPRRVFAGQTDRAVFDPAGNIYFAQTEGHVRTLHRLRAPEYTANERVSPDELFHLFSISPDGEWVIAISTVANQSGGRLVAISTRGLATRVLCAFCSGGGGPARMNAPSISWTRDGRLFLVSAQYISAGAVTGPRVTVAVPLRAGQALPDLPVAGISSIDDYLRIPGARKIPNPNVFPGASPDQLFSYASTVIRNLYRVRIP